MCRVGDPLSSEDVMLSVALKTALYVVVLPRRQATSRFEIYSLKQWDTFSSKRWRYMSCGTGGLKISGYLGDWLNQEGQIWPL